MKKLSLFFFLAMLAGCATAGHKIKATLPSQEVVEAEGMAPIIKGDLNGAKQTSLHDAMKNALGLVIGVYVSQKALVSKAMLIEDNIKSQTEGYIEKYDVLSESHDESFYKTKIRALIKKEDLSAKLKSLDLEPKKLGNPIVYVSISETIDGIYSDSKIAENEIKKDFSDKGFTVSDSSSSADIAIKGKAASNFNTDQGLGGMISYRANVSLNSYKSGSKDIIATNSETVGGIDVTKDAAAKAAILNGAQKIGKDLPSIVLNFLQKKSTVSLTISNIENLNQLNDFTQSVRVILDVRDCWVRNYSGGIALIDIDMKQGAAPDCAKDLERLTSFKVKVTSNGAYDITAELVK